MRIAIYIFLLCSSTQLMSQNSGYKWYKGNTHTHSLWSDGNDFPEMIVDWYKSRNYDFLALSDHNTLGDSIAWTEIPAHPFRQNRFKEYQQKFGPSWVEYKTDSSGKIRVRLKKLEEYRPLFEEKGKFLLIQAEEITQVYKTKQIHINAVNVKEKIMPAGGNSVTEVMQNTLDQVYEQRKRTGQPMFPHINHPNFRWSIKVEDMMELKGERFFEVFNGHPHVHNYGDSATIGMDELWDRLLIHYIQQGKPLLYGLATDDAHNYLEFNGTTANPGRGWIMVRAKELTPASIIEAMEKGDFYATTGVELKDISYKNNKYQVDIKVAAGVNYTIQFWGAADSAGTRTRKLLKEVKGVSANYTVTKKDLYVRAKIISSKLKENPFQEGDMETAWTQPVLP
jgi:hypothetical protein